MDPFTHGLLGATYASLFNTKRSTMRAAAFCGAVGALAPDLDVLIRSAGDPMLALEYHRHFTHSVFMAPILSVIVAGFWWLFIKRYISFSMTYVFTTLGMLTHGMLDAMTNYGTHLLWPFSDMRENWSIISIVDPLFTLPLLIGLILAIIKRSKAPFLITMLYASCYWGFGLYQREQATQAMFRLAQERGQVPERYEVKPSFGNLIVWRTMYAHDGLAYIDAVRTTPLSEMKYYGGSIVTMLGPPLKAVAMTTQSGDVGKFSFFSDHWLAPDPNDPTLIGDIRFATLPYETGPLWAIRINPDDQTQHVQFLSTRKIKDGDFTTLWHMIQGLELGGTP